MVRLHLLAPRLRKTREAERYGATADRLDVLVTWHGAEVTAKHQADIPTRRETHKQAVADALTAAVAAAAGAGLAEGTENEPLGPWPGT